MAVLSIEQVLAAEAKQLHGGIEKTRRLAELAKGQQDQHKRILLNEDRRGDAVEVKPRRDFYVLLNELNSAALCCSGGGRYFCVISLGFTAPALAKITHLASNNCLRYGSEAKDASGFDFATLCSQEGARCPGPIFLFCRALPMR
jgi:hypothetical protein